jgi:hypothetical protein
MTERERKMAILMASIIKGDLTVNQLRRRIADGKAALPGLAPAQRAKTEEAISLAEETIARIEAARVKYDRRRNN